MLSLHENPAFSLPGARSSICWRHGRCQCKQVHTCTLILETAGVCEQSRVEEKGWIAEYVGV